MSREEYYANDGGIFIADDFKGYILEAELNDIAASENIEKAMSKYPLTYRDIVPERSSLKERVATTLLIGLTALGGLVGGATITSQFMDSLRSLH